MLKMALFDRAINEKCCSVDGGRGICTLFSSSPRGIWTLNIPHPREFAIQGKTTLIPGGPPGGGGGRLELTDVWSLDWLSCSSIWNIEQEKGRGKEKVGGRPAKLNEKKGDRDLCDR